MYSDSADCVANVMRFLNSVAKLSVAAVINVAVELTITWNGIRNLYSIGSAGQLIPTIIGVAAVLRVIYVLLFEEDGDPLVHRVSFENVRNRIMDIFNRPVRIARRSSLPEAWV